MTSDGSTPQKQEEQITSIYPVLRGQKLSETNSIPPRGSTAGANAQTAPADEEADLIDFGQNGDSAPPAQKPVESTPENEPAIDVHHKSTAEIQSMLAATGTPPVQDEPLLDFHQDMKKDLPRSLKRGDTEESHDEFVDAQE